MEELNDNKKAWIVAVDMGYGHQRTAYPLRFLSPNSRVINANNYEGINKKDKRLWYMGRNSYEFISRFRRVPFIGEKAWSMFDYFQKIMGYYPIRDLSQRNLIIQMIYIVLYVMLILQGLGFL